MPVQHRTNVLPNRGILAEAGVNERNVAMSATETIAVNERVLGADPLVALQPADEANGKPETPGASAKKTSSPSCCRTSTPRAKV